MTFDEHLRRVVAELVYRCAQLSADIDSLREQLAALSAENDKLRKEVTNSNAQT